MCISFLRRQQQLTNLCNSKESPKDSLTDSGRNSEQHYGSEILLGTAGWREQKQTYATLQSPVTSCSSNSTKSPCDHYGDGRIVMHTKHPLSTAGSGLPDIQSQWALVWHGSPDPDQNISCELLSLWCPFAANFGKALCSGLSRNGKAPCSSPGLTDTCGMCITKWFYTDSEDSPLTPSPYRSISNSSSCLTKQTNTHNSLNAVKSHFRS
jgi:hypothetical protein